tara:strand:+ start:625 stop:1275 length:651 start_codon:yes stop_codon:yes gene_type:complete
MPARKTKPEVTTTPKETDVPKVAAPVTTEKKAKKATKTTTKPKEPVMETTPTTNEVVTETETTETSDVMLADTFASFLTKLQNLATQMNLLKTEFRVLEKKAVRELKTAQKAQAKRKRKSGNRSPSGFVKPTLISDELAKFLNKACGTEMARTEVTREINSYIRAHDLQDKTNGRKINPDANLAALLKLQGGDELTYFNLQRYMSPHFAKAGQTKA